METTRDLSDVSRVLQGLAAEPPTSLGASPAWFAERYQKNWEGKWTFAVYRRRGVFFVALENARGSMRVFRTAKGAESAADAANLLRAASAQ